jgi:uncharacterized protein (DUF342 family)
MSNIITPIVNNFRGKKKKVDKLRAELIDLADKCILTADIERLITNSRKLFSDRIKKYDDDVENLTLKFKRDIEKIKEEKEQLQCEAMQREIEILKHRDDKEIIKV